MSRGEDILKLASELEGLGMTGTVTQPDDLRKLVEIALEYCGRIDAVVNNTGHPASGDLLALGDDDWHSGLDLILLNADTFGLGFI